MSLCISYSVTLILISKPIVLYASLSKIWLVDAVPVGIVGGESLSTISNGVFAI